MKDLPSFLWLHLTLLWQIREEEFLHGDWSWFRMWKQDLCLLSKDLFSFAFKPSWVCFLLQSHRFTPSDHLHFHNSTFHVHGSGVSRPETPDTVFFRTPLPVQSYFPNEGISLASKCQRLVYLFIENMKYFLACILPGTMDKKMSKIYFLTRKTRLIEM